MHAKDDRGQGCLTKTDRQRITQPQRAPIGHTPPGFRTLGALIADSGGSSRQAMAALGHDDLKQAELYSEASDRRMQGRDAMMKVTAMIERRKVAYN